MNELWMNMITIKWNSLAPILLLMICILIVVTIVIYKKRNTMSFTVPFDGSVDLTGMPIITMNSNNHVLYMLLDSGCSMNAIDKSIVTHIDSAMVKNNEKKVAIAMNGTIVYDKMSKVTLSCCNKYFSDYFVITDFSIVNKKLEERYGKKFKIDGILGVSFFNKYKYILDFNKNFLYIK